MPGLLDFPSELIGAVGNELGAYQKVFRITCKQINAVVAPSVLSLLVIDLPRKIEPTLALLEELAKSAENPGTWGLYVQRLKIAAFYPTSHAPWEATTTRKCWSHLRRHLQLAVASLKNLRHVSWDVGMKKEPGWLHGAFVAGLATLPNLQSMEVKICYCRDTQEMRLERISTLSSLRIVFEDHYSNDSAKHKPELLGLPRVIANNHSLKRVDILIEAFHSAPRSELYLNELLDERSLSIEPRERLSHLGLRGIFPMLSQTTVQQLRFLKSITIHSHDVGGGPDNIENFWGSLLEEKVELEEIVTDRMTVGLGRYLRGSRGLRKLEFRGARLGSHDLGIVENFYRNILPRLTSTLHRLVLDASRDKCWCINPDAIKHLSQCTELRYLAVTVDGILHAKPNDPSNHIAPLIKMVSENLQNLQRLKIGIIRKSSIAQIMNSIGNIRSCILKYHSQPGRVTLPDIQHDDRLFYAVDSGDGLMKYVETSLNS